MIKQLFLAASLLLPGGIAAQTLLDEAFLDNANAWPILENDTASAKIEKGYYKMSHKMEPGNRLFVKNFPVEIKKDENFYLEFSLKLTEGLRNDKFAFLWGAGGFKQNYEIEFRSDNAYAITKNGGDAEWKESPLVSYRDKPLVITIERDANLLYWKLNGQNVLVEDYDGFKGDRFGIRLAKKMRLDLGQVYLKKWPIHIKAAVEGNEKPKPENLGFTVNSAYEDKGPVISPDGRTLLIWRKGEDLNFGGAADAGDIWFSVLGTDGEWGSMKNIETPLNNDHKSSTNYVISVTPDGNTMLVGGAYTLNLLPGTAPVYITRRSKKEWLTPQQVIINNYKNDSKYLSFCMSADEETLLMAVKGTNTFGDRDLYASFLQKNKTWSEPRNLGPVVNSIMEETDPFLASDGRTLYFATNGKPGHGEKDLFVTKRLDDSWTSWSTPKNLGSFLNTEGHEGHYSLSAKGDYAYMTSNENLPGALGAADVYRIKLPKEAKPDPVILVYGKVLDKKTGKAIDTEIIYYDESGKKELGRANSSDTDGGYKIVLPYGKTYSIVVKHPGYYPAAEIIDLTEITEYTELQKDITVSAIEVGQPVRLNNVFFEYGTSELLPASFPELDRLKGMIDSSPMFAMEVTGHTDSKGTDAYNLVLSTGRVKAVLDYMLSKGLPAEKIQGRGFGEHLPVATNDNDFGRSLNRRVDFTILKSATEIITPGQATAITPESLHEILKKTQDNASAAHTKSVFGSGVGKEIQALFDQKWTKKSVASNEDSLREILMRDAVKEVALRTIDFKTGKISYIPEKESFKILFSGTAPIRVKVSPADTTAFKTGWPKAVLSKHIIAFDDSTHSFDIAHIEMLVSGKNYQSNGLVNQGEDFMEAKEYEQALKCFERALLFMPADAEVLQKIEEAQKLIDERNFAEAMKKADENAKNGRFRNAAVFYKEALGFIPQDKTAKERLLVVEQEEEKKHDPEKYLMAAFEKQDQEEMKKLAGFKVNPNLRDDKGKHLIYKAIEADDVFALSLFLPLDLDLNLLNKQGQSPLMAALETGKHQAAQTIAQAAPSFLHQDQEGSTALIYALKHKNETVAKLMLNDKTKNMANNKGETPLYWAVKNGFYAFAADLLKDCAIPHAFANQETPMQLAVLAKQSELVGLFLKRDGEANAFAENGVTFLTWAVKNDSTTLALALEILKYEAVDTEIIDTKEQWLPLHYAVKNNNMELAKALLQRGANPNGLGQYGWTPLHTAADIGSLEMVKLLIENGADHKTKDINKKKPKRIAEEKGHTHLLKDL